MRRIEEWTQTPGLLAGRGVGWVWTKLQTTACAKRNTWGALLDGWEAAAGPFADDVPRSVADIDGPEALTTVRAWKKAQKAAGKTKQQ